MSGNQSLSSIHSSGSYSGSFFSSEPVGFVGSASFAVSSATASSATSLTFDPISASHAVVADEALIADFATAAGVATSAGVAGIALSGTGSWTGSVTGNLQGSASFAVTASAATSLTFVPASASYAGTDWNAVNNRPVGLVSSSVQINTGSFTGSLTGSLLGNASTATSATFAGMAGNIDFTPTASSATTAVSASWATGSLSASTATSASFATTASAATSITFVPATASFATDVLKASGGFTVTGTLAVSGNLNDTGYSITASAFKGDGSQVTGVISASYALSASFAPSAVIDFHTGSYTGSFTGAFTGDGSGVTGIVSATHANQADSASWAPGAPTATASFANETLRATGGFTVTHSLAVSGNIDATGYPVTASAFKGDGSQVTNVSSASYAVTSSAATSITFTPSSASYAGTDWSAINNRPVGVVSSSAQINTGSFTGSVSGGFVGTDKNTTITGSFTGSLLGSASFATTASAATSLTFTPPTASNATTATFALQAGAWETGGSISSSFTGSFTANVGGITGSVTGAFTGNLQGSSSFATTASAATSLTFVPASASYAGTDWNAINNRPVGVVSSSAQVNSGSFTGSFTGTVARSIKQVGPSTTPYTASSLDSFLLGDTRSGSFTMLLPDAQADVEVFITKPYVTASLMLKASGSQLVASSGSVTMSVATSSILLQSSGSNWFVIDGTGDGSNWTQMQTASFAYTASFAGMAGNIDFTPTASSAITASWATGSLSASTANSASAGNPNFFANSITASVGYTGSFTGAFKGDGTGLSNIPGASPTGTFTGTFIGDITASNPAELNSGSLFKTMTIPAAPPAGQLAVWARKVAGRSMLKEMGPYGVDYILQPSIFQQNIAMITAGVSNPGSATATTWPTIGCAAVWSGSSAVEAAPNYYELDTVGAGTYISGTTGAASSSAFIRTRSNQFIPGTKLNGTGGFFYFAQAFFPAGSGTYAGGFRAFVGLSSASLVGGTIAGTNFATGNLEAGGSAFGTASCGFLISSAKSNAAAIPGAISQSWHFQVNTGTTSSLVNTGCIFDTGSLYDFYIYMPASSSISGSGATAIYWRLDSFHPASGANAPAIFEGGSMGGLLPPVSKSLSFGIWSACYVAVPRGEFAFQRLYCESDR